MPDEPRGTPEWWRDRLLKQYLVDHADRSVSASLYDSTNAPPVVAPKMAEAYRHLVTLAKTPWGRLIVDIVAERIKVEGIAVDAQEHDTALWDVFLANKFEAMQRQLYREALALGTSYVSVWPNEATGAPKIRMESALAVTHETAGGDADEVLAAIKVWFDSVSQRVRVNLSLGDAVYKWQSQRTFSDQEGFSVQRDLGNVRLWESMPTIEHEFGVIMVPFVVRPDWRGYGQSDLGDVAPTIQRIESLTTNALLAVELGAFRQKWVTGIDIPVDPNTQQPVEPFKVAIDRLFASEDPDTKFGAFDSTDIRPYLQAISDALAQLSAVSRIPNLYFNQSELSNPPSAASLEASETGLIHKVRERQDTFSDSHERVGLLCLNILGRNANSIRINWADSRTRSEAQMMDAASKYAALGVPFEAVMEYVGRTPDEIKRLVQLRAADTFNRLLASPLPTATLAQEVETPVSDG